ncbi:MAG: hypothetical protein M3M94_07240 [Actinomycetota bacterium]|nr:hypothetical protein [Actinomycetota bacterium]
MRSRAAFVAVASVLFLAAGVSATWPAINHVRSHFLAGGAPGNGEASPGDYLQTAYGFWLVGHQLERAEPPWRDPYSFQPESAPSLNFRGWPFGLAYWPLERALGALGAWNALVLLGYVAAGGLASAWLRELGLPRGAALAGGLAFALAPYRVAQSTGHLLGPISILLPLALFSLERARRSSPNDVRWIAAAGAALASIPLSGQVHLALGATPFFVLYAVCRLSERRALVATALAAVVALAVGALVGAVAVAGSINAGGRSLDSVREYSAGPLDLVLREMRHGPERFVYLGWVLTLLAAAGLSLLLAARRYRLATALGLGAAVPIVLALGTNTPFYALLWHAVPPFRYPRVPERLMPIACLALAALAAVAVARIRLRFAPLLAVLVLLVDLHVEVYGASAADGGNRAYTALRSLPSGRLLELPVFLPGIHYGSVYHYYAMQAPRERPAGYSTLAPREADTLMRSLERLNCGDWASATRSRLDRLGVRYVAFHRGLFLRNGVVPDTAWFAWRGLVRHGFRPLARGGAVTLFGPGASNARPPMPEPKRGKVVLCQGWQDDGRTGRTLSADHGALWTYGSRPLRLRVTPHGRRLRVTVDGRSVYDEQPTSARLDLTLRLSPARWHAVGFHARDVRHGDEEAKALELKLLAGGRR